MIEEKSHKEHMIYTKIMTEVAGMIIMIEMGDEIDIMKEIDMITEIEDEIINMMTEIVGMTVIEI